MTKFNVGQMVIDRVGYSYEVLGYHSTPQADGTPIVNLKPLGSGDVPNIKLSEDCLYLLAVPPFSIHKTVRDLAIRHKVRIRRYGYGHPLAGHYEVLDPELPEKARFVSYDKTATSGIAAIKKYLSWRNAR